MSMGERIRQARLEAGLSQRELAGEEMTRNMLSALEHDGANPSVTTLKYLSEKLCKPIGYFFGESLAGTKEMELLGKAREAWEEGKPEECLTCLEQVGPTFGAERDFLKALANLLMAENAVRDGRLPYAKTLLEQSRKWGEQTPYFVCVERRWLMAMAATGSMEVLDRLEYEDDMLLLRARWALEKKAYAMGEKLLDAVEKRGTRWFLLRGECYFHRQEFEQAIGCYQEVEKEDPQAVCSRLEVCFREVGDYKQAYYYATKNR